MCHLCSIHWCLVYIGHGLIEDIIVSSLEMSFSQERPYGLLNLVFVLCSHIIDGAVIFVPYLGAIIPAEKPGAGCFLVLHRLDISHPPGAIILAEKPGAGCFLVLHRLD